jgi:deoxyribonuclease-1
MTEIISKRYDIVMKTTQINKFSNYILAFFLIFISSSGFALAGGNYAVKNFQVAKKILPKIYQGHEETIYCGCRYYGKEVNLNSCGYIPKRKTDRAKRLEWEHVVPAEAFGQSFAEWRVGRSDCKGKGRRCAQKNPEFARMEADLYNLWPVIGELNGLRSNYSMAELTEQPSQFGGCKAKVFEQKFEPEDKYKGIIARTYMYMDKEYPGRGIISGKNEKLFQAWSKLYPVTAWECERSKRIKQVQKNENQITEQLCKTI